MPEGDLASLSKILDLAMLVLTGGKTRTAGEHRELLAGAGFRLNQVIPAAQNDSIGR